MLVLPVPDGLPVERRAVTIDGSAIRAITFDFGNTLVPVGRAALRGVVETTADRVAEHVGGIDRTAFLEAWAEERERQFREEVPRYREVDITQRLVRVFARLRGNLEATPDGWDDEAAAEHSTAEEVAWAVDAYSAAFVEAMPAPTEVGPLLARLSTRYRLAILSNWPLAATIDRYVEANGWGRSLQAVVVSQRVGTIKPHPSIFAVAREALGDPTPESILHVGDDWAADVVGAATAGWRTAWLDARPEDSPLPSSERDDRVEPDLVLNRLVDLEAALRGPSERPDRVAAVTDVRPG
jgi:FMN phosphatase YigB (HAD superfamily)